MSAACVCVCVYIFKGLFQASDLILGFWLEPGLGGGPGIEARECIMSMMVLTKIAVQVCVCLCVSQTP